MAEQELSPQFSFRSRAESLGRFKKEVFDLLVIGGGITGAAVARDAATRGLKVALVERKDFAYGTSSRSSKLIHGGLRYLENLEFGLVFEALAERALLLKTVPHMVRPLPFYLPVYEGDSNGKAILSMGLWLYDLLALFRTPGSHKMLSAKEFTQLVPFVRQSGLKGGFSYYDASMWDDVLAVETLRSAHTAGAAIANYCEAVSPIWNEQKDADARIIGFRVKDLESDSELIDLKAHRVVVCAGPWTDQVGGRLSPQWRHWLNPSKGVHLIFDLKRIPLPGAVVMVRPEDGRVSFVIPRPDLGTGVVIVGTTDGPTPKEPDEAAVDPEDVEYIMSLLNRYFPDLALKHSDILSAYVGVRPLMGSVVPTVSEGKEAQGSQPSASASLQKVSREHHIGMGPGGSVVVAGGKYTTHRKMAEEIVDYTLKAWKKDARSGKSPGLPPIGRSGTKAAVNPRATARAIEFCRQEAASKGVPIPEELLSRYGAEALSVLSAAKVTQSSGDPAGFPQLVAQLRHSIRSEMVMHLEDFYLRRIPLYASRADHGLPWAEALAQAWAEERGMNESEAKAELARLQAELDRRSAWKKRG